MSQNQKDSDVISKTKHYGEKIVRQTCPSAVIVRPATMYNNPDHFVCYACSRTSIFFESLWKSRRGLVKMPTSMLDVGRAIALIVLSDKYHGKTFELFGKHKFYLSDIMYYIYANVYKTCMIPTLVLEHLPFNFFARRYGELFANLAIVPPHFIVNDIPSTDNNLYTFEDLGIEPTYAEDGINHALQYLKPYSPHIDGTQLLRVYEQPQLRLITKQSRDVIQKMKHSGLEKYYNNIFH
ncbi:NADH dehydrogenase [ubiquinone] 1 alpha subcomplex subunit 9, mitochondrial [Thelohanellus kitauei]|uniref:NADH dehydrogenase [ubiquinone] 1 alpha subcomplex subunit 9, mitochondrial n=1 Tax=Thelohanellus kitauei TaxID=669202 RepID=A0A0C2MED1_THEKT|nr:NADH dehydrogenase [ubiquinone] 1 alpha subcomplex subunit 9, mitochondrial [Thelohanellus kitauei]